MPIHCTRCEESGFLNLHQMPDRYYGSHINGDIDDIDEILKWIKSNDDHDVQVCDCCGDGEGWYGTPGEHYNSEDPSGNDGPYAYNGGYCECH